MLTQDHGTILLRLARQTIAERLGIAVNRRINDEDLADPALQRKSGVFVTLHKHGRLRGCIGSLTAQESIAEGVRRNAINAAFHDYRFPPVTRDEFDELQIEVSVLTPPRPLEYTDGEDLVRKLRVGVDGVILRDPGGASATFLPQVWDQLPEPAQFLDHLCRKAGLPASTWRTGRLHVDIYQVIKFEEGHGN